ncbi:hypothetical protein M0R72_08680 [Candidatus Pacearchaeota archaeon]|jgi:hypothetical protein|nr:hypothetical protein [Candidatus Pacearchaeota archaeon]
MGSDQEVEGGDEMKKLLEELKTIDPACYAEIERGLEQVDIEYEEDIIQGALQRAIVTKGWHWLLENSDPSVRTDVGGFVFDICDKNYDVLAGYIQGDSPAKAILTAYLAARKAQP